MVAAHEIEDQKSLEAWLDALPRDDAAQEEEARRIAVAIAHRAAMRVLPLYWRWSLSADARERDLTALPILRASLIAGVAGTCPTPAIRAADAARAAADAADAARAAAARAARADAADAAYAARAARAAADAAHATTDAAYAAYAADAAYAAYAADATTDAAVRAASWEAIRQDCAAVEAGTALDHLPLWHDAENPLHEDWAETRAALQADGAHWQFWIDWYEAALSGTPLDTAMLTEIATTDAIDWDQAPEQVNARIAEIVGRYAAEGPSAADLLNATLFDFRFDELSGLMRAVPLPEDWKTLEDPERLAAFLEDAGKMRESIDLFVAALQAEGGGVQGAGAVGVYFNAVQGELRRADDVGELRVDKLMEYGRMLESMSANNDTKAEFGALAEPFRITVEQLRELMRTHFAHTLARFSSLRTLRMEEDASPARVLGEFRSLVNATKTGANGRLPALAPEDAAMLDDVMDSLDTKARELEGTNGEAFRDSLQRELDFTLAKVGATITVYQEKAAKVVATTMKTVDTVQVYRHRFTGVRDLAKFISRFFRDDGSG